jgi:hypothetical protein
MIHIPSVLPTDDTTPHIISNSIAFLHSSGLDLIDIHTGLCTGPWERPSKTEEWVYGHFARGFWDLDT